MPSSVFSRMVYVDSSKLISNFPDTVYDFKPNDKLTYLMNTLLGDSGAGQLLKTQNTASLTQDMPRMEFSDLDNIPGKMLGSSRLNTEQYGFNVNPYQDQLVREDWDTINMADSSYRERLALMLTAINHGATVLGITLLCEAILGQSVRVIEAWKAPFSGGSFVYPSAGSTPVLNDNGTYGPKLSTMFKTDAITEFLIVPKGDVSYPQDVVKNLIDMVNLLKPENSIATFYVPAPSFSVNSYTAGLNTINFATNTGPRPTDAYSNVVIKKNDGTVVLNTYISSITILDSSYSGYETVTLANAIPGGTTGNLTMYINANLPDVPLSNKQIVADSEWYEFDVVTAVNGNVLKSGIKELSKYSDRYWLDPASAKKAPLFAHFDTAEENIDLTKTVSSISLVTYPSPGSINIPVAPPAPTSTPPNSSSAVYAPYRFDHGDFLISTQGRYKAIFQNDGNFVVYDRDPSSTYSVPLNTTLSYTGIDPNGYGSTGTAVVTLQRYLNQLMNASLIVNGQYNVPTKTIVEDFQTAYGLDVTGICDAITWAKILWALYEQSISYKVLWQSATPNQGAGYAKLQLDGNFVIYTDEDKAIFQTGSSGKYPVMVMQNDDNLVMYETSGPSQWQIFGAPYAIWSSDNGVMPANEAAYNAFVSSLTPTVQGTTAPQGVVYGPWISIGLADSSDNYPGGNGSLPGMYPGDINHYATYQFTYTGSTVELSNLSVMQLDSVTSIPQSSSLVPGSSSVVTTNGIPHVFTYTGIDTVNKQLTGCAFTGDLTNMLQSGSTVTVFGNYLYEWDSQSAYVKYIKSMVKKLGGQLDNEDNPMKYRIPVSNALWSSQVPSGSIKISDILAPPSMQITSTVYGAV